MFRKLTAVLVLVLTLAALPAQGASLKSFSSACPNTKAILQVTGTPKLGSTITVSGLLFPGACTRKFCGCACCKCNTCSGSVLFIGVRKLTLQLTPTCQFRISPDILLFGNGRGQVILPVPNNVGLIGKRFYMQRLDLGIQEYRGTQCATTYVPMSFAGSSDALEGIVGR